MDIIPVKSETLKVDDRKKVRDKVLELFQITAEMNGALLECRKQLQSKGELVIKEKETIQKITGENRTYCANVVSKNNNNNLVTVKITPNNIQNGEVTKRELVNKIDIVTNQIGISNIKKGRDGTLFVECISKGDANRLTERVPIDMSGTEAKEIKKK